MRSAQRFWQAKFRLLYIIYSPKSYNSLYKHFKAAFRSAENLEMFTDNSSELSLCLGALHEYQPRELFWIEDEQKNKRDPPSNGHHGNVCKLSVDGNQG